MAHPVEIDPRWEGLLEGLTPAQQRRVARDPPHWQGLLEGLTPARRRTVEAFQQQLRQRIADQGRRFARRERIARADAEALHLPPGDRRRRAAEERARRELELPTDYAWNQWRDAVKAEGPIPPPPPPLALAPAPAGGRKSKKRTTRKRKRSTRVKRKHKKRLTRCVKHRRHKRIMQRNKKRR